MAKSLGIFVSSNEHLDKIIALCRAAKTKDIEVTLAKLSLCNVGFESHGLKPPVVGIAEKDYATQARNGEMIEECDRYLAF
ncbi:MAG: hypothetical protein P8Y00_03565 [Deltaproteobacteria bacterium]